MSEDLKYTPADICKMFNISKTTLFRWEERKLIPEPERDQHGYRLYTEEQKREIARALKDEVMRSKFQRALREGDSDKLRRIHEEMAAYKFLSLGDLLGLFELRELAHQHPLDSVTVAKLAQELPKHAVEKKEFKEIVGLLYETTQAKN